MISSKQCSLLRKATGGQAVGRRSCIGQRPTMRPFKLPLRAAENMQEVTPTTSSVLADPAEVTKGCIGILRELRGLGFSSTEAQLYFSLSQKLPKGYRTPVNISRARIALDQVISYQSNPESASLVSPSDFLQDSEGILLCQEMLSEIWRWRRRGGGMEEEDYYKPHLRALREIQSMEIEDIDRITSSVLDSLPISDEQKREMSSTVQQAAMGGINGAVWGSLVMCLVGLIVFNFLRSG